MPKAKNAVIAGDYNGRVVKCAGNRIIFDRMMYPPVEVSDATVDKYEVIDSENAKSALSIFGRGAVGGLLLGPLGMVAGALSAPNSSVIIISIEFKNGDKSLIEVDKNIYKVLMKILYK